jgi:SHS2 domain-containing protein
VGRFVFVEDIALADCAVDLEGVDLADLFETGASALAHIMVDPATLPRTVERQVSLATTELDLLLYDWLSELIFRKDRDGEIFPETEVRISGGGPYTLTARVRGGAIDPERTELRADPKAVTFHQFSLGGDDGGWRARVIFDI